MDAAPITQPLVLDARGASGASDASDASDLVADLARRVRAAVTAKKVTPAGVTIMVTTAMGLAERIPGLTGPQKKDLVISAVLAVVDEAVGTPGEPSETRDALRAAAALLAPGIVDAVVAASKGQLGINGGATLSAAPAWCAWCCFRRA
jgi:hypothetical protein